MGVLVLLQGLLQLDVVLPVPLRALRRRPGQHHFRFEMGDPATPFEQLMGVFPKQSAHAIPLCYRHLLSDPKSEIIDFYPTNFHIDINGARYEWMGVALLPFIDRKRLVKAMKKADRGGDALTEHEKKLNTFGDVYLFFENQEASENQGGLLEALQELAKTAHKSNVESVDLFASFSTSDRISGTVKVQSNELMYGKPLKMPYARLNLEDLDENNVFKVAFEHTKYELHLSKLLDQLAHPERVVEDFEIHHINRRFFGGERTIKMLEGILGFESNLSAIYRGGYQNNRAVSYEGVYQPNNRS